MYIRYVHTVIHTYSALKFTWLCRGSLSENAKVCLCIWFSKETPIQVNIQSCAMNPTRNYCLLSYFSTVKWYHGIPSWSSTEQFKSLWIHWSSTDGTMHVYISFWVVSFSFQHIDCILVKKDSIYFLGNQGHNVHIECLCPVF